MPALLAYILAVAIFVGGGYGALSWLAGSPEPASVAAKARHAPRPVIYGAATTRQDPLHESATDAPGKAEAANLPAPSTAPAASSTTTSVNLDKRYDAMARAEPAAEKSTVQRSPMVKPGAALESAGGAASTTPEAKPEAAPGPAVAKTISAHRPPQRKRQKIRQAEEHRHPRYEVMTLRTIEYPDGRRETRLLPPREGDDASAFRWGD